MDESYVEQPSIHSATFCQNHMGFVGLEGSPLLACNLQFDSSYTQNVKLKASSVGGRDLISLLLVTNK
jgi:hypothetical protein